MNFARSPSPQAPIAIGARLDAKTTMIWPILPPALIHTGVSNTMPHLDLDKTDIKILAALQQNGRTFGPGDSASRKGLASSTLG